MGEADLPNQNLELLTPMGGFLKADLQGAWGKRSFLCSLPTSICEGIE